MNWKLAVLAVSAVFLASTASAAPTYNGTISFFDSTGAQIGSMTMTCGVGSTLDWGTTSTYHLIEGYDCVTSEPLTCEELGNLEIGPCGACGSLDFEQLYLDELVDPCS
jgi:hypothetical protein